jgi:DNA-binding transcriptional regulator YhcF (GntR family)
MSEAAEIVLDGRAPIAQQVEGQIRRLVREGALRPGEVLPTVREAAVALVVSPRVIEQAYDRLERAGWLTQADGSGPRVITPPGGVVDAELVRLCRDLLRRAAERGFSSAAVWQALQVCLEEELSS